MKGSYEDINNILSKTISTIEESHEAIFEIAENARKEKNAIKKQLEEAKLKMQQIINEAEKLQETEKTSRKKLLEVSRDFSKYNEEDIKKAYEKANELQIMLMLKRQEESELFRVRTELEKRYKNSEEVLKKAEEVVSKIGIAVEYLSGNIKDITSSIEDIQQKQNIGKNIIRAQEEERQRVARDIHDGPAQALANVTIKAEVCEKLIDIDKEKAKEELQELRRVLREGIKDIRKIIYNLRPMALDDLGFVPTLKRYIENFQNETGISTDFIILSQVPFEDPLKNLSIFRIVQEALNNVRKHSMAKNVKVKLEINMKSISLNVSDDGVGFSLEDILLKQKEEGCYGLQNIKERTELLSGTLQVKTEINKGTRLLVNIPNEE